MDENIYQIAEQIVQLHQKAYEVYLPLVVYILVREYRCSGGTETASPVEGNR